jgi:hypothetical protein
MCATYTAVALFFPLIWELRWNDEGIDPEGEVGAVNAK